ncbi:MAG: glycoside hydrolase family 2 protein [Anaerolineae bacterium]|jgi:beta-mannosidase
MGTAHSWNQMDLTDDWQFAWTEDTPPSATTAQDLNAAGLELRPCRVPGNLELDLQAAGLIDDPFVGMTMAELRHLERAHVWYVRRFTLDGRPEGHAELLFEGLDCCADIYLNGVLVGSGDNMLIPQVHDVNKALRQENELLIHIFPAVDEARRYDYPPNVAAGRCNYDGLYIRKAPHMYGWDIMPRAVSAGIWRPVTLRFRPEEHLESAYLQTQALSPDGDWADLAWHYCARVHPSADDIYHVRLRAACGDSTIDLTERLLFEAGTAHLRLEAPQLWWPRNRGPQSLYACTVELIKNGATIDTLRFRTGIRTVRLERTSVTDEEGEGEFCFWVNGERVFAMGSNWVPLDAYHSRDRERIPMALAMADDLGCNMLRCWGGNVYEDDLFYNTCDEMGILIWQDFAMACAVYPQDASFQQRLADEAQTVVRRLRHHPCIALWAGDNECDQAYTWAGRTLDPNDNVLTRKVLPEVLRAEDATRPYLPSSPYVDAVAHARGQRYLPENHLWGPRDYFKSRYYTESLCHFASEIGYHGCPAPSSMRRFLSPDKVWPYQGNEEWLLHATSPVPGMNIYDGRVELMANQVRELFGQVPDDLDAFVAASQISQAEAFKFHIELFRTNKWRRTGILWWNLLDGWPQFSDAIVDYYGTKKLAYSYIKRAQQPLLVALREPLSWRQELVACNDTRQPLTVRYQLSEADSGEVLAKGEARAKPDAVTMLGSIAYSQGAHRFYTLSWRSELGEGQSHYLAGNPPFDLQQYLDWLDKARLRPADWLS